MNTLLKRTARFFRLALLFFASLFLVSCASLNVPEYYGQLISGQMRVLSNRTPIQEILADKHAPDELKKHLRSVLEMREFAIHELGLPATESFTTYMDSGRKFVQWSLTATPEFSIRPKLWCVPIIGCASHLTFFNETLAKSYEKKLAHRGYDVYVRGVTSYSTEGYFNDPAMNTLFELPDYVYASIIFHEMAHEKLRVKNESNFNESFATFVGRTGRYLWVKKYYGMEMAERLFEQGKRSAEFSELITGTWKELARMYGKNLPPEKTRILKRDIFLKMKERYAIVKTKWGGYAGFDDWFKKPLNNARIAGENEYGNLVPAFQKLFDFSGGDFRSFYRQTEALAKLSPPQRKREIQKVLNQ